MDKYNFARLVARERKDEIDHDLAVRHMLREAEGDMPNGSRARRLVMRFAPIVIVISALAYFFLG
jgi:hypothetical protein